MSSKKKAVLFVCVGNICRSPALEALLKKEFALKNALEGFSIASCGIAAYRGNLADRRMCAAALQKGISIEHKAELFSLAFFDTFDYIFAVDYEVLGFLQNLAPTLEHRSKLHLCSVFGEEREIPDPYYGGEEEFMQVLFLIEEMCKEIAKGLLD